MKERLLPFSDKAKLAGALLIFLVLFMTLGIIYSTLEDQTLSDGMFYSWQIMTTVGLETNNIKGGTKIATGFLGWFGIATLFYGLNLSTNVI